MGGLVAQSSVGYVILSKEESQKLNEIKSNIIIGEIIQPINGRNEDFLLSSIVLYSSNTILSFIKRNYEKYQFRFYDERDSHCGAYRTMIP